MTWRPCPFTPGGTYLVTKEAASGFWKLRAGDKLIFVEDSYSRIDGASIFYFQNKDTMEGVEWWLYDDDPLESWKEIFEKI